MKHDEALDIFPYFFPWNTYDPGDIEIYAWCAEHFGPFLPEKEHSSSFRWCTGFRGYYFKHEKDYMMAVLRWS